jgi:hypothetical protein
MAARRRSTALVSTTAGSKPVLASVLNIKPLKVRQSIIIRCIANNKTTAQMKK